MSHNCSSSFTPDRRYPFDSRGIAKRFRHAAIFGAFQSLNAGKTMLFINDHDPLPLIAQFKDRYDDFVEVNYFSREPGQIEIEFSLV